MPSGGARPGSGRPKGSKNGSRKKKSNFKCVECFNCTECAAPIGKKAYVGSGICGSCNSTRSSRLACHAKWVAHECEACGVSYSAAARQLYCSSECRVKACNDSAQSRRVASRPADVRLTCAHCDADFSVAFNNPRRRYCGIACRRAADNEFKTATRRTSGITLKPAIPVSYRVLRDAGWKCVICGVDTPESLRGTVEPNAPEVDHIHPVSRGGTHEYGNLQCLCRKCNGSKGAKLMSEWVPDNDNFRRDRVAA